jgi:uncharacterized Zn finger protein
VTHPSALPADRLARLIDPGAGTSATLASLSLSLPTRAGLPLPSPGAAPATDAIPDDRAAPDPAVAAFAPWAVPTLALDPADATTWLLALRDGVGLRTALEAPDAEPIVGSSLRWLAELAGVALDLVRRGRFLPGSNAATTDAHPARTPRWLPVPAPADLERLTAHAAAMPGVLRATIDEDDAALPVGDTAPPSDGEPAVTVLERALGDLVDALIRSLLPHANGLGRPRAQVRSNPTGRWLAALTAPIPGPPIDAPASLLRALDAWQAAASGTARRARASFRLSPPRDDEPDRWRVDVHLQSVLDPSLQVPATAVWARRGTGAVALEQALGDPQDLLLAELGRATRLAPMLAPLLEAARPTGLDLDTAAAHAFLRDGAPVLAEAGFGVVLPSWWRAGRPSLAARATVRSSSGGTKDAVARKDGIGTETLVEVDWEVLLEGQALTAADLVALAALKAPLVRVRGTWVELRPEDLDAALRLTSGRTGPGRPPERMTVAELIGLEAGIEHRSVGLPVSEVTATGWLARIVGGDTERSTGEGTRLPARSAAPAGFVGTLRPYQLDGLAWLEWMSRHGLGACLADDMGLGKTAQLIALLAAEREDGPAVGPTLVICPMSVVGNWQRELERFSPDLRVHVHHGAGRAGIDDLVVEDGLKARSRRGPIGERWWSQRFIAALERLQEGGRLERGRAYARAGQVMELHVDPGLVTAKVQGSRPRPYRVEIGLAPLGDADWQRAEAAIAGRAVFLARLLSGEMPDEIEEAFAACSLSLFPVHSDDLKPDCSCPDWAPACKHVAAVYYLLAERFDEDPFLILAWRGRPRDRLLAELRLLRGVPDPGSAAHAEPAVEAPQRVPLDPDPERFWGGPILPVIGGPSRRTPLPDAILRTLPPSGLVASGRTLEELLTPLYRAIVEAADEHVSRNEDPPTVGEQAPARPLPRRV